MEKERVVYYEKLAHVMMEAGKSHDLPSVKWRKLERHPGKLEVNGI